VTPALSAIRPRVALTPGERDVARLAAAGRTNPQIAAELHLSRRTASTTSRTYPKYAEAGRFRNPNRPSPWRPGLAPVRAISSKTRTAIPLKVTTIPVAAAPKMSCAPAGRAATEPRHQSGQPLPDKPTSVLDAPSSRRHFSESVRVRHGIVVMRYPSTRSAGSPNRSSRKWSRRPGSNGLWRGRRAHSAAPLWGWWWSWPLV
jgi:hypothetical protein